MSGKKIYAGKNLISGGLEICKGTMVTVLDYISTNTNAFDNSPCVFEESEYVIMEYGVKELVHKAQESYISPVEVIYEYPDGELDACTMENGYLMLPYGHIQFIILPPRSPSTQLVEQKKSDGIIYVHPEFFGKKLCVGNSYKRIKDALRDGREKTADEISHELGIPINRVSGRLSELCKEGIVSPVKAERRNGRWVKKWAMTPKIVYNP